MVALFVAMMFIGFLLVDVILQRVRRKAPVPTEFASSIPPGFYISEGHSWSHPDSSLGIRVGADALVVHALGTVEKVTLPKLGGLVEAGQPLFRLERQGCGFNVQSSITGRVVALNTVLATRPESVAKEPYGSGWICAITPTQSDGSSESMRCGQKAALWLGSEFNRFREFLTVQASPDAAVAVTCPDGGEAAVGSLTELPPSGWRAFETQFLTPSSIRIQDSEPMKK